MKKGTKKVKTGSALMVFGVVLGILFVVQFVIPTFTSSTFEASKVKSVAVVGATTTPKEKPLVATHVKTPTAVKGIYMTACVAGTPSWRTKMAELVRTTELNTIIVDIKDYSGTIAFIDPALQGDDVTGCRVRDMREFVAELHEDNIYVIGRVTVFQDPYYAKKHPELAVKSKSTGGVWKDKHGLPFIDVGAKPYWDHVIQIAKTSYNLGFDEINFDYVRYPSDGNMADAKYTWTMGTSTKADMVENFFSYLHANLKDTGIVTSADLFGLVTVAGDDLGIGQVLTRALPYFDYISPMVYPSHFASGSGGFKKPAENPYGIIHYSMLEGVKRAQNASTSPLKLRPWLQDFDLGANYGVAEVQAQIKATYDVGLTSWLLWDASNKYTPAALLAE
jgi:hypothetical protein